MNFIKQLLESLEPVGRDTNPNLACVIGFLFGGVGLAVYFRTVVDLVIPVAIVLFAAVSITALGALGWVAGAIVAAVYGYLRAVTSNEKRASLQPVGAAPVTG